MTVNFMLDLLKSYVENKTAKLNGLHVALQKDDNEEKQRAPEVHKMRLPNSESWRKSVPYIIVQYISGKEQQPPGEFSTSTAVVRFIFCVYNEDEECGAKELNNVMDCLKIEMLKDGVIGDKLKIDKAAGIETFIYPDDTAPYVGGEIVATFETVQIEREVYFYGQKEGC